jgi:hypothetical protein
MVAFFSFAIGHDLGAKKVKLNYFVSTKCPFLDSLQGGTICPYLWNRRNLSKIIENKKKYPTI